MLFSSSKKSLEFDSLRLKVASPEEILKNSHGEILKPETINYRTQKPEKDGLFCERIFGPTKDWECYCGKYKKIRYKGIICDKCGVEVTHSSVRRERMGHIELSAPATHIWFLRGVPSRVGLILDLSIQNLEKVVYFASFIITKVDHDLKDVTIEELKVEFKSKKKQIENQFNQKVSAINANKELKEKDRDKQLIALNKERDESLAELQEDFEITEKELKELEIMKIIPENIYQDYSLKYGHIFEAQIGAEAIRYLLEHIDLDATIKKLDKELDEAQGVKREKLIKRIKLIKNLYHNNINPAWMVLTHIPVIPPDLRPMVALDGGRFATSDLNDLYRRVINRNNRLKKLLELNAPEVIIRNEKRMLQEAVDALIDNSARHTKTTTTASTGQKRQLKSLADILKGKQGRFRQNLLGKRIDYSGRSVIVVGPKLQLHQCGLPKIMALELFKPFIISQLIDREYVHNIRSANRFIETGRSEIWDILEEIVKDAHVLLNRAPTLHRLGIQAFQPILIEGKAIQLHPLVCAAFNADFDGDQMAVHVPLTEQAKWEAKNLMLASNNILKPATGSPIATPRMDMVWGCYYITEQKEIEKPKYFSNFDQAVLAYQAGVVKIQEKIVVKDILKGKKEAEIIETNVGRILFNRILPDEMPFYNQQIDSKTMGNIIQHCLEICGQAATVKVLDEVKNTGFYYLTKSGYSWGMDDMPSLPEKGEIIEEGNKIIEEINEQFEEGLLTQNERHSKIIETWTNIKDKIVKIGQDSLDKKGTVYSMVTSGSRGSWGQVIQMVGMKGLVTNPAGEIIELPVKSSFKEGFTGLEYFISSHGTRKGLADTALRTASAGYLTRRLVDVSQDIVVSMDDCGDEEGLVYTKKESEEIGVDLLERVWGRHCWEDIKDPKTKKVIVKKGEIINSEHLRQLKNVELEYIRVRSVLTCKAIKGVCKKCYGFDLGFNKEVDLGSPVGIVAAQSIGEPGTQLTMRTFHTGGVAGKDITQGLPRVEELFEARPPKRRAIMADVSGIVSIKSAQRVIEGVEGEVIKTASGQKSIVVNFDSPEEEIYKYRGKKTEIKVKEGDSVKKGQVLLIDTAGNEVKAQNAGVVTLEKNAVKVVYKDQAEKEYLVPSGYEIWVKDGDMVGPGDQLTEGDLDLHQLFKLKGKDEVKKYIVKEIQYIYSSQGQKLNEKHIEVIIKQLFSRMYIKEAGDTNLLPGEIVEKSEFERANQIVQGKKGKEAVGDELFLGISKVALSTSSFLSAASFQETSKVLINAAITGKQDRLEGLKENVIIGHLIPAGTGFKDVDKEGRFGVVVPEYKPREPVERTEEPKEPKQEALLAE